MNDLVISSIINILRFPDQVKNLAEETQLHLILNGVVLILFQDASPASIRELKQAVTLCPIPSIQNQALKALILLATDKYPVAVDALFYLYIYHNLPEAENAIETHSLIPSEQTYLAAYYFLSKQKQKFNQMPDGLSLLTNLFFQENQAGLQEKLLKVCSQAGMSNWGFIVTAILQQTEQALDKLLTQYAFFNVAERNLLVNLAQQQIANSSKAIQELVCRLFIQYEETIWKEIAINSGIIPEDPVQRSLFLFLSEQWSTYQQLDFNHSLLQSAYENASEQLRKQLLNHSRRTGFTEWLDSYSKSTRIRWIRDLNDADWEIAIKSLLHSSKYQDLWILAQSAPPIWSAQIIQQFSSINWIPDIIGETIEWHSLQENASTCLNTPLSPQLANRIKSKDSISCLATNHPKGIFAVGGFTHDIFIGKLPEAYLTNEPIHLPAPQARNLVFSPDGEFLVVASNDNNIRILKLSNGKVIKNLSSHQGLVRSLLISHDGRFLFSAGFDGAARSWRFPEGTAIWSFEQTGQQIFDLALSPANDCLFISNSGQSIQTRKIPEGHIIQEWDKLNSNVLCLAIANHESILAGYSQDQKISIWNWKTNRLLNEINVDNGPITAMQIHPGDGFLVSAFHNGKVALWNLSTGNIIFEWAAGASPITGISFDQSGEILIVVEQTGIITLWDLQAFLASRTPLATANPNILKNIQEKLLNKGLRQDARTWLGFIEKLLKWRCQFDIQVGESHAIRLGEFDIEL